jgi:hypothetical protein
VAKTPKQKLAHKKDSLRRYNFRKESGLCTKCGGERDSDLLKCAACRERANASMRKTDVQYRLRCNLRNRISCALKAINKDRTVSHVRDLGCTIEELRRFLEVQFHSGMSWDNYGTLWHIDHIFPLNSFDLSDEAQQKKAVHYLNLQPMLAEINLRKGSKVVAYRD